MVIIKKKNINMIGSDYPNGKEKVYRYKKFVKSVGQ